MILPIPDGHRAPTTPPVFKSNLVPRTGSWMVPSLLTLPNESGWLTGGHLSPSAKTAPLGSTAMQMARPPATPEVADPGAGRSSVEIHGTYLREAPFDLALRAVVRGACVEGAKAAAEPTRAAMMTDFILNVEMI